LKYGVSVNQLFTRIAIENIKETDSRCGHETLQKQSHYWGADKSLARPERKQATATEDFDVHISYL